MFVLLNAIEEFQTDRTQVKTCSEVLIDGSRHMRKRTPFVGIVAERVGMSVVASSYRLQDER